MTGAEPLTWLRVPEATEALEIYPADGWSAEPAAVVRDGTVLAIVSVLKRAHMTGTSVRHRGEHAGAPAHRSPARALRRRPARRRPAPGVVDRGSVNRVAENRSTPIWAAR